MKISIFKFALFFLLLCLATDTLAKYNKNGQYIIGVGDTLEISILQPDQHTGTSTVSPDGYISVVYIGNVMVRGKTIPQVKRIIEYRLSKGYLKYPVVSVSLQQSRSRRFTVSGEVNNPGTYILEDDTTVLKAISMAGGFTRYGSSSKVKLLRPKKNQPGYKKIIVNLKKVMDGKSEADILIKPGDIIVVSQGLF